MIPANRDQALDGLRGAAAIMVVYLHFVSTSGMLAAPGGGQLGVVIFFVLSGFLITRILWSRPEQGLRQSWTDFVRRRARRLYPPIIVILAICGPLMALADVPADNGQHLFATAIVLTQSAAPFAAANAMPIEWWGHTWSLSIEWCFYLSWPLAVWLMRRRGLQSQRASVWTGATALALFAGSLFLSPRFFYFLPPANIAAMLVGAALALREVEQGQRPARGRLADVAAIGLVAIVALPSNMPGLWAYRVTHFPFAIVVTVLLISTRHATQSLAQMLLRSRPLVAIGRASYSLYLWHFPLLAIIWFGFSSLAPEVRVIIAVCMLPFPVWLSYRYIELPRLRSIEGARKHQIDTSGARSELGVTP
ncbi:hypothetical protein GCM10022399_25170 [Terrabacter ginsenosidimutans]|uniref:Acyltransferase 3 domain-containing protein n=1 Tax=Terrabacter ginsenosidimutans TaxID=490575 RepID=A0ABP7DSF8_9MICO